MHKFSIYLLSGLVISAICNRPLAAQDSHYWTQHYGTQSTLLAGTVIGSFQDMSAVYYNPAAIAQMDNPAFLLSARAFDLTSVNFHNGAGSPYDLDFLRLRPAPDILAGIIPTDFSKRHRLAYFYLTRQYFRFQSIRQIKDTRNAFRDTPADDHYSAEAAINIDLLEDWFGLTYSYKYEAPISVGISHFFAYRSNENRQQLIAQAYSQDSRSANTNRITDFSYYNVRMLWKAGIAADLSPLTMGLTVTTPSISLFGSGRQHANRSSNGLSDAVSGQPILQYDIYAEENLPAYYRSGWALGLGASYRISKSTIHFSAEWYEGIPAYKIMDASPYTPPTLNEQKDLDMIQDRRSVVNVGIGYELKLADYLNAYGGVTTDFSALPDNSPDNSTFSNYDIYHLNGGILLRYKRLTLNLGGGYASGRGSMMQLTDFNTANEDNLLIGERSEQNLIYRRFKLVVGFSFHFRPAEKNENAEQPTDK